MRVKALNPPASMVVVFDDVWQPTQIYSDSFTSGIRDDFMQSVLSRPGEYRVQIYDKTQQIFQQVGVFRVTKPRAAAALDEDFDIASCKIHAWGPDHTELGYNFNKQPSGHSAFWVKTNCAYQGSELVLGNQVLETTIHDGLLTAMVTNAEELSRGGHKLMLRFGGSGKAVEVGTFKVD